MQRHRLSRLALWFLCLLGSAAEAGIRVEVLGLKGAERENVEQRLRIRQVADAPDLDALYVESLHARAQKDIREALQPFGYYSPSIEASLSGKAPNWRARYRIDPGPATEVETVAVALEGPGGDDPQLRKVAQHLPIRPGQRLSHLRYEESKTLLNRAAYGEGYLDAAFTVSELQVDPEQRQAVVRLTLDTGPRFYFGPVQVEQDVLRPEIIARYVRIETGEPFDPEAVLETQFALTDLDYFQTVEIEPQRAAAENQHIPVVIRATERKRRKWDFGVGYGTDTGPRVSVANEVRWLNDRGHKLRGELQVSEIKDTVMGEYRIPLGSKSGEYLGFGGAAELQRYTDGESSKYLINTSLTRLPGDWRRKLYINFEHEESKLSNRRQTADLLVPGITLDRSEFDDPIHARRGWSVFTDLHGSEKSALSNVSFVQSRTQLRGVYPLAAKTRLWGRVEYGTNITDRFSDLPASQRFFAGGDQSVRGYRYQSLGPKDAAGEVVGGRYLFTSSLEVDYFFRPRWGVAAFFDAGGADNRALPELSRGAGLGVRFRAPVGDLQVDVAQPLDQDEGGFRLHFGVRVGL